MFRTVASLMTAAGVLWHAVSGCCAHHGHGLETLQTPEIAKLADSKPVREHRCPCKHKSPSATHGSTGAIHYNVVKLPANTEGPSDNAPHGPCEGERCSFVVGQITTASDLDLFSHCAGDQIVADVLDVIGSEIRESAQLGEIKPPPLRRHLALSILLI